jgi:hypothetical protein
MTKGANHPNRHPLEDRVRASAPAAEAATKPELTPDNVWRYIRVWRDVRDIAEDIGNLPLQAFR